MEELQERTLPDPASDLVERYCAEARSQLEQAQTRKEALEMKESFCSRLARECGSRLVVSASRAYIEGFIDRRWKNEGETGETSKRMDTQRMNTPGVNAPEGNNSAATADPPEEGIRA